MVQMWASAHQDHISPFFSQAATTAVLHEPKLVPLTYLEGFPKPDAKHPEMILAIPRATSEKSIAAKERKACRVPSIVFEQEDGQHGGNKRLVFVQTNQIRKLVNHLGRAFFLSRLYDLEVKPAFDSDEIIEKVHILPRWVQMWIHRPLLTKTIHLRFFSQAATAAVLQEPEIVPLTYLEGFPKPDAKHAETILAIPRATSGKSIAAKERKAGRVPSIVFEQEDGQHGGNKRLVSVQTNQIRKLVNHLGRSFFLSRLFDLEVRPAFDSDEIIEKVRVLPRWIHLHSGTDAVLNVTFLRAPSHALIKVDVPLVFIGDDVSPGLRKGAYLNTIKRTVQYLCPADIVPPYIDVDLSELDVGRKLVMGDLKVHPALRLLKSKDEPVCKIMGARVEQQKNSK